MYRREALLVDAGTAVEKLHKEHQIADAALSQRQILHAHDQQDRDGMRAVVPTVQEGEVRSIIAKSHWQRGPPTATAILGSTYYPPHNAPRPDFGLDSEFTSRDGRLPAGAGYAHALPSSSRRTLRDRLGQTESKQKPQTPLSNSVNRELLQDPAFKGAPVYAVTPRSAGVQTLPREIDSSTLIQPSPARAPKEKDPEPPLDLANIDLASLTRKDRIRLLERTIEA